MTSRRRLAPLAVAAVLLTGACSGSGDEPAAREASPRRGTVGGRVSTPLGVPVSGPLRPRRRRRRPEESAAVTAAFQGYKQAALAQDGPAAAALLTDSTADFYDAARSAALTATEPELAALGPVERLTAVVMRGQLPVDVLRTATPQELLAASVDAGLIGEQGIQGVELGEVTVSGSTARAAAVVQGTPAPFELEFVEQDGGWKLDLLPLLQIARQGFDAAAERQGVTADELLDEA
jgi:hypothetical protein